MKKLNLNTTELLDLFPVEGSIDMIFGGLGAGKTYAATADMIEDMRNGLTVYSTFPVDFTGYDERKSLFNIIRAMFGLKKTFFVYRKELFNYIPLTTENFMDVFSKSTNCVWYVDEAYAIIDSYVKNKMTLADRFAIYGTRHFDRRLVLIAQRPSSIHVAARAMVNRFYKCVRPFPFIQKLLHITFFIKTEYQDMVDENVDLEKPLSTRWYFGRNSIFKAYNSKYLRGTMASSQTPQIDVYRTNPLSVWSYLFSRPKRADAPSGASSAQPLPPPVPYRRLTDILPP